MLFGNINVVISRLQVKGKHIVSFLKGHMATHRSSYLNFCVTQKLIKVSKVKDQLLLPELLSTTDNGLQICGMSDT